MGRLDLKLKYIGACASGLAVVFGVAFFFAAIVWLISGIMLGFSSGIQYDARMIARYYWYLAIPTLAAVFVLVYRWQLNKSRRAG